jgi:MscS family membrane protein
MKALKRFCALLACVWVLAFASADVFAADAAPDAATAESAKAAKDAAEKERTTAAAAAAGAAAAAASQPPRVGFLEHLVDAVLEMFDVRANENTVTHYTIAVGLLVIALLARRVVTLFLFKGLRRLASKTETTLDDKLFTALEGPVATFIMLVGIFAALSVLKLSPESDRYIGYASTVAFSLAIFWFLWRGLGALMEHAHEVAVRRNMGISAFMPWIRKSIMVIFALVGVLMVLQSFGVNVKAALAGLGLGGLAFALAAQDTLANVFGSIVVAIDQPFKIGEFVHIGPHQGAVEDVGLRSTKLRRADKSLIIIPNKTVAAEAVTNLARFTRRRNEQVIGLTYDTKPEQMDAMVQEIRGILTREPEIDANSVMVFFRDLNTSSLDIWLVYETPDPDFQKHMRVKQRMNLAIMRAVYARGLSFAFPSQSVYLAGDIAERLAARPAPPPPSGSR